MTGNKDAIESTYWMSDDSWFIINNEYDRFELTDEAPMRALESYKLYCWINNLSPIYNICRKKRKMMKDVLKDSIYYATKTFSTHEYDNNIKTRVLQYLKSEEPAGISGLIYDCRIGDYLNDENLIFEKDGFCWDASDIYYFEKYNAELSSDFYEFIKAQT